VGLGKGKPIKSFPDPKIIGIGLLRACFPSNCLYGESVALRLFIKQALLDIVGGVADAQKEAPSGSMASVICSRSALSRRLWPTRLSESFNIFCLN
jgi:hypothetical protein